MQNAREIVAALEAGKREGDGVINCAISINRSMKVKKACASFSTAAFTSIVGKARDNMYYTEFSYKLQDEHIAGRVDEPRAASCEKPASNEEEPVSTEEGCAGASATGAGATAGTLQLDTMTSFAYYKFGCGVELKQDDLARVWPSQPAVDTATILAGSYLADAKANVNVKMERQGE